MNSVSGLFYAIISSATFGLIPLFTVPSINSGVAVNTVVFARFFISFVAMGIVMLLKGKSFKISKNDYKTLCWLSFFYASTSILLTLSYLYIPSGMATTIHFLYPVLVTLIMILLFKESGNWTVYTAIFLAVMGVAFLGHSDTGGSINTIGLTLALITVCTYATYIVGVRKSKVHEMDSFKMTFYILMNCAIIFFINVLVQDGGFSPIPDTETALNLVMLALISTLVSDLTLIVAVQKVGPTTTAILGCMEPLTAVSIGVYFLGETCNMLQIIGIIVILFAVILTIIGTQLRRRKVIKI